MDRVGKIDLGKFGVKPGSRIVDVGCGAGHISRRLEKRGYNVYGIDTSPELLHSFLEHPDRLPDAQAHPIQASGTGLPFPNGSVDGVIMIEVLEHIDDAQTTLEEINRIIKPGGKFCLAYPTYPTERVLASIHPRYRYHSGHVHLFTKNQLRSLIEQSGFRVVYNENHNFEWSVFWLIHSLLRSQFHFTGVPTENYLASKLYWRMWDVLRLFRLASTAMAIGNYLFPKSWYFYCEKRA